MSAAATHQHDSDSEDDPDFVPTNQHESDSSGDERDTKRPRNAGSPTRSPRLTAEEEAAQKKAREELWAGFQASVASTSATPKPPADANAPEMVKIEKRYRFAGDDVIEVKEVPADSDEARKWPVWRPPGSGADPAASASNADSKDPAGPPTPSAVAPSPAAPSSSSSPAPRTAPIGAASGTGTGRKPPGRRKPKVQLAELPGSSTSAQKAKKLTTLEKSAMDWSAHVQDPGLKDELEANQRGGGYLEKVQFLQRVEERRDEMFDASKGRKRRRT
ncbi:hypothetical protein DENSPDRAFT_886667 [Dentipellis sp. KUC8613]|nr:hypothetical protein DENSPDRAFT_886667 [Dentipellis sp. KUC8613]